MAFPRLELPCDNLVHVLFSTRLPADPSAVVENLYTTCCGGASLLFNNTYNFFLKHETLLLETALGSLLAAIGIHPKLSQEIMRHGDINLTLSRYTHTLKGQKSEALSRLPDLSLPSRERQRNILPPEPMENLTMPNPLPLTADSKGLQWIPADNRTAITIAKTPI